MPRACRRKAKTTMILVKQVTVSKMAGATERIVSRKRISRAKEMDSGSAWPPLKVMLKVGIMGCCPQAAAGMKQAKRRRKKARLPGIFLLGVLQVRGEQVLVMVMGRLREQGDG